MANGDILSHEQVKFVEGNQDMGGNPLIRILGKVVLDHYATDGYLLDVSGDIKNLLMFRLENVNGISYVYDYSTKKIMAFWGDNNNSSDAPLIELPAAEDTSDPTVRYEALGT